MRRLRKELDQMQSNPSPFCNACSIGNDLFHWRGTITGPPDMPYSDGVFSLDIEISNDYPMCPPKIIFLTRVYHPNIDNYGNISLNILRDQWSPSLRISTVLLSICALLSLPFPDDPLVPEIAYVYKTDRPLYDASAREWTRKYHG